MGERERGYRRVTMLTGGLAAVSIAGTLGVAMAAHAAHTAEQETVVPAGGVPGGAPAPAAVDGQPAPDTGSGGAPPAADDRTAADPADDAAADAADDTAGQPPAEEFPEVTGGGNGPGQATTGGS